MGYGCSDWERGRFENWSAQRGTGRNCPVAPEVEEYGVAAGADGGGVGERGKSARAFGTDLRELGANIAAREVMMGIYRELIAAGTPTRAAAALVGVPRATASRKPRTPVPALRCSPSNKLTDAERARVLSVVNSDRFIDHAPIQIFAQLLDEGTYLCSVSTFYWILVENAQVKERRRLARHRARAIPELVATSPGQVYLRDITKLAGPSRVRILIVMRCSIFTPVMWLALT